MRTQPPDIWVHLGHGEPGGLQEYGSSGVTAVERWLHCFYGCELQLAMFLTCESDLVARRFAQAGAAVAIGLTGQVLTDKPRTLGREVLQAAMSSGGSRETVLAAFLGGAHRFAGVHQEPAEARVYYPVPW